MLSYGRRRVFIGSLRVRLLWRSRTYMPVCPHCRAETPEGSRLCVSCDTMLAPPPPSPQTPLPPPVLPQQPWQPPYGPPGQTPPSSDPVAALIPYKNAPALSSYYMGLFSGIPLIGLFLAGAAIVMGIRGLDQAKANPAVRGKTHAIVGIITGTIGGLFNLLIIGLILMALLSHPRPS